MRTHYALPLVSALALALPALADSTPKTGPQLSGKATTTASANSGTQASGNTSSSGTTSSTATVDTTTAGNAGSSALVPSNQTSGSLESGQVSSGTGTGRTTGVRPIDQDRLGIVPEAVPSTPAPAIVGGDVIAANGERIAVETIASVQPAPAATTPTPELDAATRAAERKLRAKTARNQQLMHSITPRTNVDRTDQMPDDPIVPTR